MWGGVVLYIGTHTTHIKENQQLTYKRKLKNRGGGGEKKLYKKIKKLWGGVGTKKSHKCKSMGLKKGPKLIGPLGYS